mmetsp:Transcript_6647/g.19433  ORF Transcript_6647/g.19433 Transcript_6647/m.19433 type:complete len:212 (+) Transcript_6647:648-1283(+)
MGSSAISPAPRCRRCRARDPTRRAPLHVATECGRVCAWSGRASQLVAGGKGRFDVLRAIHERVLVYSHRRRLITRAGGFWRDGPLGWLSLTRPQTPRGLETGAPRWVASAPRGARQSPPGDRVGLDLGVVRAGHVARCEQLLTHRHVARARDLALFVELRLVLVLVLVIVLLFLALNLLRCLLALVRALVSGALSREEREDVLQLPSIHLV